MVLVLRDTEFRGMQPHSFSDRWLKRDVRAMRFLGPRLRVSFSVSDVRLWDELRAR
jgi:hypothetical protein